MSTRYFDTANSFSYNVIGEGENALIRSTQNAIFDVQRSSKARIAVFEAQQNTILTGDGDDVVVDFAGSGNTVVLNGGADSLTLVDSQDTSIYAFGATGEKFISGANSSTKLFMGDQLKYVGTWMFHATGKGTGDTDELADLIVEVKNPYAGDTTVSTLRFHDITVSDAPQLIGAGFTNSCEKPEGAISEPEEPPTL